MFSHYTDSNKEIICKGGFLLAEKNFLVDHLISEIKGGTFQLVDKKLPSEHILADQFNVPRMVARKAYEQLQDLGFIYSKQGKGSYVQETKKKIPLILFVEYSLSVSFLISLFPLCPKPFMLINIMSTIVPSISYIVVLDLIIFKI